MKPKFNLLALGCTGGPFEGNISSYLVYPSGASDQAFMIDGGSVLLGLRVASLKGNLSDFVFEDGALMEEGEVFLRKIKGYLISHAHIDHVAGFMINSQVDSSGKFLAGTERTIDGIRDHLFNHEVWPNYGSEGQEPVLNKYHYVRLPYAERVVLPSLGMSVECYPLAHPRDYISTAFLLEYEGYYLLYCGDTASDALEKEKHLARLWRRIAPLIRTKQLRGLLIECSVPEAQSGQVIYGHLNPRLLLAELSHLREEVGEELDGLKIVVTHRKESLLRCCAQQQIADELCAANHLGVEFIFPEQGDKLCF